jgi:hypothetical protein
MYLEGTGAGGTGPRSMGPGGGDASTTTTGAGTFYVGRDVTPQDGPYGGDVLGPRQRGRLPRAIDEGDHQVRRVRREQLGCPRRRYGKARGATGGRLSRHKIIPPPPALAELDALPRRRPLSGANNLRAVAPSRPIRPSAPSAPLPLPSPQPPQRPIPAAEEEEEEVSAFTIFVTSSVMRDSYVICHAAIFSNTLSGKSSTLVSRVETLPLMLLIFIVIRGIIPRAGRGDDHIEGGRRPLRLHRPCRIGRSYGFGDIFEISLDGIGAVGRHLPPLAVFEHLGDERVLPGRILHTVGVGLLKFPTRLRNRCHRRRREGGGRGGK